MRQGDHPRVAHHALYRKVRDIGMQSIRVQPFAHGGVIHDPLAGQVEHHGPGVHAGQRLRIDQVGGVLGQRHVYGDGVGPFHGRLYRARPLDAGIQAPGVFHRDLGVEADDFHAQRTGGIGDADPDCPQAQDGQTPARQFEAGELLLALLHRGHEVFLRGVQFLHVAGRRQQVAGTQQQPGDDQLLHRIGIRAGGVEHGHAALGQGRHRDIVDPAPGAPHRQDRIRDLHRMQIERAQHQRVRLIDIRGDLVMVTRETIQPAHGDVVVGLNPVHHDLLVR